MQTGGREEEPRTSINVTRLVDISLVLVIIFMVTAPIMSQTKLKVTLPVASTDESKNEDHVIITIDSEGKMSVDEKTVSNQDELASVLQRKIASKDQKIVVIKADLEINHGTVIDAMETAKKVKPKKV